MLQYLDPGYNFPGTFLHQTVIAGKIRLTFTAVDYQNFCFAEC